MPDVDEEYARRGGRLLLPVLFWAGVGLAPLAGLLLLLGNGGSLRVGAFLGVLALVLVGLSIALRPDANTVRLHVEELLLDELDQLRAEVREEIASASRATHQTVGERLGAVQQLVESLRAERARYAAPYSVAPSPATANFRAVAPHPAAHPAARPMPPPVGSYPVAAPRSAPPPVAGPRSVPPPAAPAGRHPTAPPVSAPAAGNGRAGSGGRRGARHQADGPRAPAGGRAAAPSPAGGVYRHTETVQVTTRSTYVDEHSPNGDGGRRHDGGYGSRDWSGSVPRSRPAEPYEQSWTDQKLRERYGRRPRPYDRADDSSGEQPWTRDSAAWSPVSAEPVSGLGSPRDAGGAAGSDGRRQRRRWDEDRSGELRMGERRAAQHSDERGTELRLEERWASVRRDDNGYDRSDRRPDYAPSGYGHSSDPSPDYTRPALPATSSEPSWNDSWDEPASESRGHRYRPDFELSDERWR